MSTLSYTGIVTIRKAIPKRSSKGISARRTDAARFRPPRRSRQDEADIAVSERLIRREKPVALKKVLKEFGR